MKKTVSLLLLVVLALFLASCAAGPNSLEKTPARDGKTAGFWKGLWHGLIAPIAFIISIFSDQVRLYEVHNNGGWYNFGFLLGVSATFSGAAGSGAAARPRRAR